MKVSCVSIESSIINVGFRRMAALIRTLNSETEICYVVPTNHMSISSFLLGKCTEAVPERDVENISRSLANSELVAFSSMTPFADVTEQLIARIKNINPDSFIIWGGVHPIVAPESAIQHADAICTGEGEIAFREFFAKYREQSDYTGTKNFWFKKDGRIIKNGFLPLLTSEERAGLPLPLYAENELIYKTGRGFVPLDTAEYKRLNGISYHTVWSIGCPYSCAYCCNSKFTSNDSNYRKIRYAPVELIIDEIKSAKRRHPYISAVVFHDDSFMGLPVSVLREFAGRWSQEVDLSFSVVGALPSFVSREKLDLLLGAGMRRVKMGIQTGSDRILKFYKRPATAALTRRAISIISEFGGCMIPPTYDVIVDNPTETRQDVIDSLRFIYQMPRPYNLNVSSLRLIPNTELTNRFKEMNVSHPPMISESCFTAVKPLPANILMYTVDVFKLPERMFEYLLRYVKPFQEEQREFPVVLFLIRSISVLKRGFNHLRFLEFSYFPGFVGRIGYFLWKLKIMELNHHRLLRRYRRRALCSGQVFRSPDRSGGCLSHALMRVRSASSPPCSADAPLARRKPPRLSSEVRQQPAVLSAHDTGHRLDYPA